MTTSARNDGGSVTYVYLLTLVAALGGLLFGYDTAVIADAIGYVRVHFELTPFGEGFAAAIALAGCALGAGSAGFLSDRFGRKKMLILSALAFFVSAVGTALPRTLGEFIVFRFIGGVGIGAASITSPMYIAEIAPFRIRGRLVSLNQLAIVAGMLIVYFVNYFIAQYGSSQDQHWNAEYGWRWMFGSGVAPALVFFFLLLLVPESPRWLTKKLRRREALAILTRVDGAEYAQAELRSIEESLAQESGRLSELWEPWMRRLLLLGVALAVLQQVTGVNVFLYFAPKIFESLGAGANAAMLQTILVGAVMLAFTILAIGVVDRLGRKPLMLIGSAGMGLTLTALGLTAYYQLFQWWALVFVLGYIACFAMSVGPVTWVILSEIFPTQIRGRAMGLATICLWLANYVVSLTFPMMNDAPWLLARFHHGFPFWVYAAFCAVLLAVVCFWVPETKGRSLEEIERSWRK